MKLWWQESDLTIDGRRQSHYEMYIEANERLWGKYCGN
jgi:hypothetical protein